MSLLLWITTALLTINAAHSYILLTANLEDVHAIAKQLADSPVADQIRRIWRRASNQFSMQVAKARDTGYKKRADDDEEKNSLEENSSRKEEADQDEEPHAERRSGSGSAKQPIGVGGTGGQPIGVTGTDGQPTGSNASYYLSPKQKGVGEV